MDMAHEHQLDSEYLTPSDGTILEINGAGNDLSVEMILPCPECDEPLRVTFNRNGDVEETGLSFPLDDAEVGLE